MLTIGYFAHELGVEVHEFDAGDGLAGALLEGVGAVVVVELGRGDIEREDRSPCRACSRRSSTACEHGFERVFHAVELGRETAFVADGGAEAALLQHALERVEDFRDGAQAFAEGAAGRAA